MGVSKPSNLSLFSPSTLGCIKLSDLKNCKLAYIFFNTFFNLDKYLEHEQRDPFAAARVRRLLFVEFILEDGKLVSDGISSHKNPTSMNFKDG